MKPFTQHKGVVLTLDRANIDTDAIIPKQFLKSIARTGFGPQLFFDWRYLADGRPNPEFALNKPVFKNASVLVARNNFGCGSSREHAVWAIQQAGFQVVIAPSIEREGSKLPGFADIFRNNSFKNALLTIELPEKAVDRIFEAVEKNPGVEATADLASQKLTVHASPEITFPFDIDPSIKERLLGGYDDIGLSLRRADSIAAFEKNHDFQIAPAA